MASTTPKVILLTVNGGDTAERPVNEAQVVTAAVTPGDLLTWSSGKVTPNATAADADAQTIVAVESPYLDPRTATSPAIDTDYAVDKVARFIYPVSGDVCYMWLETGANVAKGAALESNGAGALQVYTSGRIVAFANEAVNNASGSDARIKVRIA
jgi:hypothetical protein